MAPEFLTEIWLQKQKLLMLLSFYYFWQDARGAMHIVHSATPGLDLQKKKWWHQQNVDVINVSALIRSNVF